MSPIDVWNSPPPPQSISRGNQSIGPNVAQRRHTGDNNPDTSSSTFASHYMTPHRPTVRPDRQVGRGPCRSINPCRGPVRGPASVESSGRGAAGLMQIVLYGRLMSGHAGWREGVLFSWGGEQKQSCTKISERRKKMKFSAWNGSYSVISVVACGCI